MRSEGARGTAHHRDRCGTDRMCGGAAALDVVLAGAVAEMEQRGRTGSVHLLTSPLQKRCVPPPSAKGHDQAMASEKGGSENSRLAFCANLSALTYLVVQKGQKSWPNLQSRQEATRPRSVRFAPTTFPKRS